MFGETIHFDEHIFQRGGKKPPTRKIMTLRKFFQSKSLSKEKFETLQNGVFFSNGGYLIDVQRVTVFVNNASSASSVNRYVISGALLQKSLD